MSVALDTLISPLFILHIELVRERPQFNNDKETKVWGLKSAKIAGKRMILDKTYAFMKNA